MPFMAKADAWKGSAFFNYQKGAAGKNYMMKRTKFLFSLI